MCRKLNRVPLHDSGQAHCGACKAPLNPLAGGGPSAARSGDLGAQVIERWDALLRLVPRGMALGRAVGRSGADDPAADPVGFLSSAAHMPRDELDQVRLLRIHLASNKPMPTEVLTRALDTLDRAHSTLARTRLPE
ncbi:MAG: hypothetical protein ACR2HV_03290 [Acidimicrobiales bacterium]